MLTLVGCQPANKELNRLSTQTRIRDNNNDNLNNRFMDNDSLINPGNNKNNLNNGMMRDRNNNMNLGNNNLNNGMVRDRNNNMNTDTNLSMDMSNMSSRATTIAERVTALPEIDDASVLISGNTAIVGCEVKGDTTNKITNALKTKVEAAVKVADRNIQNVSVTSDSGIYKRIQTMTKDMNNSMTNMNTNMNNMKDNPATRFTKDIEDILRDITNLK